MTTIQNIDEVINYVRAKLKNTQIITVDGCSGAGKSTLSRKLARKLKIQHIKIDDLRVEGNNIHGGYVESRDHDALSKTFQKSHSPLILDGICIFKILAQHDVRSDISIYVKSFTKKLNDNGDYNWVCDHEDEVNRDHAYLPPIRQETRDYHREFNPISTADLVFKRYNQ